MSKIELVDAQYLFLLTHKIIGGNPLCYALTLNGEVSANRLQKSLNEVVQANPILRMTLHTPKEACAFAEIQAYYSEIHGPAKINFEDISSCSNGEIEARFSLEYSEMINRKTQLENWPLFSCKLIKFAPDKFRFFMIVDHFISDGLSSLKILHQLLSHYSNTTPLPKITLESYNETINQINSFKPHPMDEEAFYKYVAQQKKETFTWNPSDKELKKIVPIFNTVSKRLDQKTVNRLKAIAKNLEVSFYSLIVNAYFETFAEGCIRDQTISFCLPTGGNVYPDVDATPYIGCFAQALSLSLNRELLNKPLNARIKFIHEEIHYGIRLGFDKIQIQKLAQSIKNNYKLQNAKISDFSKYLFRSSIKSNVYISFLGTNKIKSYYGDLKISDYIEGSINNCGTCDFIHNIFNDELYLFGNYDTNFFEKSVINGVLQKVKKTLSEIAEGALSPSRHDDSPSTFDNRIVDYLLEVFTAISSQSITRKHLNDDLEAQLGLDSLGRIRLIAQISKDHHHEIDKDKLFKCRSLANFASILQPLILVKG